MTSARLQDRDITVAGGGIAGLAAARALALRGGRVTVVEQAAEIGEVGAGLQITPNGMRVIAALGLSDALEQVSLASRAVVLRDGKSGNAVARFAMTGGDWRLVHRARLVEVLQRGAVEAGVTIRLGERVEPGAEGAALLIGADGLHSEVRAAINGTAAPRFTGQVAWRAVIAEDAAAEREAQVLMGPGRHLVSYPLAGGWRNIVAVEERSGWVAEGWSHEDDPDALRRAFSGFGGPVPGWLERVERLHLWGLFRHPVAPLWHKGSRTILGDAAHPTLPFLAQGANMALEDAVILAACLDSRETGAALRRYQQLRRDRCVRIVAAATRNARNFHLSPPMAGFAHLGLRAWSLVDAHGPFRRYRWIHDYDAPGVGATEYPSKTV